MKIEIITIPGKGKCLLISDLDINDFLKTNQTLSDINNGCPFYDIYKIADFIRSRKKIAAIKEVRTQAGYRLREAKEYVDKYIPSMNMSYSDINRAADRFIDDHKSLENFLSEGDVEI